MLIILGLKFVNLKDLEMSHKDYYLIVVLVLFVLIPKLRQFTGAKAPGILGRKRVSPVSEIMLIPLFESP